MTSVNLGTAFIAFGAEVRASVEKSKVEVQGLRFLGDTTSEVRGVFKSFHCSTWVITRGILKDRSSCCLLLLQFDLLQWCLELPEEF